MDGIPARCAARFRPVRELASGGFGSVHLAVQVGLDRQVAVKLLRSATLADPTIIERFRAEARLTASLTHPSIVEVIDHDVEDGVPWIAYEYLPGQSVRAVLEGGPLSQSSAIEVASCVAGALEVAHARGVVHRDVKPENVLEHATARWKLVDFGIAYWDGARQVKTATGVIVGTPAYVAPELLAGGVSPSAATDLYALGVMLYEMLAGSPPFQSENLAELLRMQAKAPPPSLRQTNSLIPRELEVLVGALLEKQPENRPASATEVGAALEGLRRVRKRTGSTRIASTVFVHDAPVTRAWQRSPRARLTAVLVALGAVGVAAALRDRVTPPPSGESPHMSASAPSASPVPVEMRPWYSEYLKKARVFWKDRTLEPAVFNDYIHGSLDRADGARVDAATLLSGFVLAEVRARGSALLATDAKFPPAAELDDHLKNLDILARFIAERARAGDVEVLESSDVFLFIQGCARDAERLQNFMLGRFELEDREARRRPTGASARDASAG